MHDKEPNHARQGTEPCMTRNRTLHDKERIMTCQGVGSEMTCYEPINVMWWDETIEMRWGWVCECVESRILNMVMMGVKITSIP